MHNRLKTYELKALGRELSSSSTLSIRYVTLYLYMRGCVCQICGAE